jgi:hypothetical protein
VRRVLQKLNARLLLVVKNRGEAGSPKLKARLSVVAQLNRLVVKS